jgi:thymidine kinase
VAHNYRKQGKRVLLMKPRLDSRFGSAKIASRSGLEADPLNGSKILATGSDANRGFYVHK